MRLFKIIHRRRQPMPPSLSSLFQTPTPLHYDASPNSFVQRKDNVNNRGPFFASLLASAAISLNAAEPQSQPSLTDSTSGVMPTLGSPKASIWQNGIGEGFRPTVQTITLEAGGAYGLAAFGGVQAHDLALVSLSYGRTVGRVMGEDRWYRGNWEIRLELFGGAQFSPTSDWLLGLTPHLLYNLATGTRWIPFLDGGAGVTATGIGPPDLSNTFEFNLQGGTGVHWFVRDTLAVTVEARYIHMSCAGISHPNLGLNSVIGMVGLTWFFS